MIPRDPPVTGLRRLADGEEGPGGPAGTVRLDTTSGTPASLHEALVRALDLPGYYGRNLDALADVLEDPATRPPSDLVVVWDGWEALRDAHPRVFDVASRLLARAVTVYLRG